MFRVPRDTEGAVLKQCLKTEGHSDLSEVVDIIIMRVFLCDYFEAPFWDSYSLLCYHYLLRFLLLPFVPESSWKYYESNFKCLEIGAESHLIRVANLFIPLVSLM